MENLECVKHLNFELFVLILFSKAFEKGTLWCLKHQRTRFILINLDRWISKKNYHSDPESSKFAILHQLWLDNHPSENVKQDSRT